MEENQEVIKKFKNLKSCEKESVDCDYRDLMDNLKKNKDVKYSLLCLFEILRIKKKSDILTSREKEKVMVSLINMLKSGYIDLTTFAEEDIVKQFNLEAHASKILGLFKTVHRQNIKYFQAILVELLEQSENPEVIIKHLLLQIAKDKSYNEVLSRSKKDFSEVINSELSKMNDKEYVEVFCNLERCSDHKLRKVGLTNKPVKLSDKLKYVEAAIEKGFVNEVLVFYYNDKEKTVRQLLAKSKFPINKNIIMRFINDNDPTVRLNIVNNLDIEESINHDIEVYDRLLDVDAAVRQVTFIFYDRLYNYIRTHSLCSYVVFGEEDNSFPYQKRLKVASCEDDENRKKSESYFLKFTLRLFKGLLTNLILEYEEVLKNYTFTFEFYHHFLHEAGVENYLKSSNHQIVESYKSLDKERKRTFFMFYSGTLNDEEIRSLIHEDLESAMYYLKDKENVVHFLDDIVKSFRSSSLSLPLSITILERIQDYKELLPEVEILSPSDLLVGAFLAKEMDICKYESSFEKIFYLSKFKHDVVDLLKECDLTDSQVFEILCCAGDLKILSFFCDRILENSDIFYKLFQERSKLIKRVSGATLDHFFKRNIHNTYLFFLMTGRIKICDTDFFISLVHFISKSATNKVKVNKIFRMYLQNVPKSSYYEFASICYALKTKSMYQTEDQEYNKIQDMDAMLYSIVSGVLNFNVYKILENEYNLEKFHNVIEENLQMVLSHQ